MVRIVNGEVVPNSVLRRNSSSSLHGTPVLGSHNSSAMGTPAMAPLTLGPGQQPGTNPTSPLGVPVPAARSLMPHSQPHSAHSTPPLHPMRSLHSPSPSLHGGSLRGTSPSPFSSRRASIGSNSSSSPHPPPLALGSAQFTNPYLSHTSFGQSAVTSGHPFSPTSPGVDGTAASSPMDEQQQHAMHQFQQAAAAAAAAAYYPFHLLQSGFMGPGFILGGANAAAAGVQQQQQATQTDSSDATSPSPLSAGGASPSSSPPSSSPPSSLPVLGVSSSCPSPLLVATAERRRSKPHIQFVPPTHTVDPGTGMVIPLMPPPLPTGAANTATAAASSSSSSSAMTTTSRVAHSFNLFSLPPLLVYEIRVPPHVYLLTALIVYLIGPPALIPIVAAFFFYRWHLQQKQAREAHHVALQHAHAAAAAAHAKSSRGGGQTDESTPTKGRLGLSSRRPSMGMSTSGLVAPMSERLLAGSSSSGSSTPNMGTISGLDRLDREREAAAASTAATNGASAQTSSSAAPSPALKPRRHPNIHSLYD